MINVERLLSDHRIPYNSVSTNASRGWIALRCVWCQDSTDHMGIHLSSGAVNCWKCGGHRLVPTLARLMGAAEKEVVRIMANYEGGVRQFSGSGERYAKAQYVELPNHVFTDRAMKYLRERHVEGFHIKEYDLRYGGPVGEWAYRIVIPVRVGNQIVAATGRTIADVDPRYYNLPIERSVIDIKHTFLGMDLCNSRSHIVLVEGPFDAVKGGPGVISGFGASLKDEQLLMLTRFKKITVLFDSDPTGRKKSTLLCDRLQLLGVDVEQVFLDNGSKDLGALPHAEICDIRADLGLEGWHREIAS